MCLEEGGVLEVAWEEANDWGTKGCLGWGLEVGGNYTD